MKITFGLLTSFSRHNDRFTFEHIDFMHSRRHLDKRMLPISLNPNLITHARGWAANSINAHTAASTAYYSLWILLVLPFSLTCFGQPEYLTWLCL